MGAKPPPALDANRALADSLLQARLQWPDLRIPEQEFLDFLGAENGETAARHFGDLYLACGCARGLPRALELLELHYLQPLLHKLTPRALAEEAIQEVRQALLIGPRPQIAEYGGRGPLLHWLRVMAVRAVEKLRVREERHQQRGSVEDALADPELAFIKSAERPIFAAAFREALAALSVRERMLLRLHYAEELSAEALGVTHGVHRATVTRWLSSARQALLDGLRSRLIERLSLSRRDADSLLRLVRSQLDFSLRGAMK